MFTFNIRAIETYDGPYENGDTVIRFADQSCAIVVNRRGTAYQSAYCADHAYLFSTRDLWTADE